MNRSIWKRSLPTLVKIVALNRQEEFDMHVRPAFNKRVTREKIQEVFLKTVLYRGLPTNNAFQWDESVFVALDGETP